MIEDYLGWRVLSFESGKFPDFSRYLFSISFLKEDGEEMTKSFNFFSNNGKPVETRIRGIEILMKTEYNGSWNTQVQFGNDAYLLDVDRRNQNGKFKILIGPKENVLKYDNSDKSRNGIVSVSEIEKTVARFYDVDVSKITSKDRSRNVSLARQVCIYLAREFTRKGVIELGELFGNRHHATVIYSIKKIGENIKTNPVLSRELQELKNLLNR